MPCHAEREAVTSTGRVRSLRVGMEAARLLVSWGWEAGLEVG